MPITLQPEHERLIAEALRSGAYQDSGEVIQRALELLRDRDAWLAEKRARIDEGYAAAQRGELIDADQVRVQMEEKKRAWRAEQRKARADIRILHGSRDVLAILGEPKPCVGTLLKDFLLPVGKISEVLS